MDGLTYHTDVRHRDPQNRRKARFKIGWSKAVQGHTYSQETLEALTWQNLGYRLGKLFGETSDEMIEEIFHWCVRQL
jgi:hypothetical protein